MKNLYLHLAVLFVFTTFMAMGQSTHIVRPGSYNLPIKEVKFLFNGSTVTQTSEASGVTQSTNLSMDLIHFKIDIGGGAPLKTVNFIESDAVIRNNNFGSSVSGVGVYNTGSTVSATDKPNWELAMTESATSKNLLNYLFYDNSSNTPSGADFDILWTKGLKSIDYVVVGERNGNTCFSLKPIDSIGNIITSATILQFGKCNGSNLAEYDWNTGYAPSNYSSQPMAFTAVSISEFNTSKNIHGFRIDNTGNADPKFFAMSGVNSFLDNPVTTVIPGITGNVFRDENALTDNTVDGDGIHAASGQTLYATLDSNGVVIATMPINEDGSYEFLNLNSGTYAVRISTVAGTVGSSTPNVTLPNPSDFGWIFTGEKAGAGTGSDGNTNGILSSIVVNSTVKTDNNFGIQQLPKADPYKFTISSPAYNDVLSLTASNGLDSLSGYDVEDGQINQREDFKITDISGLNGNTLFYDANNDGEVDAGETITSGTIINNYNPALLKVLFNGLNSTNLSFQYTPIDASETEDPTPATYQISWNDPLPVEFISFDVVKSGNNALLIWATASELNNKHFEILRSNDGKNWIQIGQVEGNGTTQEINHYTFEDMSPMRLNYYKLKQVDFNGQAEFTAVKYISFDLKTTTISTYPNPVVNALTVKLNQIKVHNETTVALYDMTGKRILTVQPFLNTFDTDTVQLDLSLIKKGNYIVQVYDGIEMQSIKIQKN